MNENKKQIKFSNNKLTNSTKTINKKIKKNRLNPNFANKSKTTQNKINK